MGFLKVMSKGISTVNFSCLANALGARVLVAKTKKPLYISKAAFLFQ